VKYSKKRELIYKFMCESEAGHFTADAIHYKLKSEIPTLSLGTVYRNLGQLVEAGQVKKISIPGEPDQFEPAKDHEHFHFWCMSCSSLECLPAENLAPLAEIGKSAHGEILSVDLLLKGHCTTCKEKT